jgi:DNA-binding NtrC family response regulator
MTQSRPVILCVDDEPSVLSSLKEQLKRSFGQAFLVETADDAAGALELYEELLDAGHEVPLLITDHIMPGMKGDALIQAMQQRDPRMLKVMLTGQASTGAVANAVNSGGLYRFIAKPWDHEDLLLTVREALRRFDDARALEAHQRLLAEMNTAALDLAGNLATRDRYERLIQSLARVFGAECVALLRVDGDRLVSLASYPSARTPATNAVDPGLAESLAATGLVRGKADPLWPDAKASIRVPLRVEGEVVGLLALASTRASELDRIDAGRAEGFAALAAAALRTARLVDDLESALEHRRRVSHELLRQAHLRTSGPLMGQSVAVRRLRDGISQHAGGDHHLLILGPPGAGCEAVARSIHAESTRSERPFLVVHCALASSLDDLFGADDGVDRQTLAEGGTLYLSGVNRLAPALQDAVAHRIATNGAARVIATAFEDAQGATGPAVMQRPLEEVFRARLKVPPLRQRKDDLPALADLFMRLHAARAGRMLEPLTPAALQRLAAYDWPGNIDELNLVIQRAVVTARGTTVEIAEALLDASMEFGGYRLVEPLASGGMGEVWRAEHRHLARPAAIKLIRPVGHPQDLQAAMSRFKREAGATARLTSPHTVELYDFGVSEAGAFFYVMEFLRGLDLQSLVTRFGPMPPERAVHLLGQACRSLQEAHAEGMVHRDIKPANLIACHLGAEFDFVKVLDFGMVTAHAEEDTALTQPGGIAGTPGYLPPECLQQGVEPDGRADLYSLGCVAWWLLTGEAVFPGLGGVGLLHAHACRAPRRLRSVLPDVPEALDALVDACLAKSPNDRPQSAAALAAQLAAVHFEQPWTEARAREWWRAFVPEIAGGATTRPVSPMAPTVF